MLRLRETLYRPSPKTYYWGGYGLYIAVMVLFWKKTKVVTLDLSDVPSVMG